MAESDQTPGEAVDAGRGRMFPCEGCGADLEFHIGQQQLKCPYCGFEKALELNPEASVSEQDFHGMLERLQHWHEAGHVGQETGQSEVRCAACGANVVFQGALTSSECPYCACPIQRDKVHDAEHRIPVDGVLPFRIEKKRAQERLAEWVSSRWFAPGEFLTRGVEGKFNGVYLPFWTFDSMTFTRYVGERGEHYYVEVQDGQNRRRERHTRWWPAAGSFQRFFDDVLILASTGLPQNIIHALEPWPLQDCVPFTQEALAGFFARTYEKELEPGFREARSHMEAALQADIRQRIGGDEQRVHNSDSHFSAITYKHLLLPVWLLAYRYHDKTYQVAINAATGEVQGERPYSWVKILVTVLIIAGIVGGIALLNQ